MLGKASGRFATIQILLISIIAAAGRALLRQKIGMVAGGALVLSSAVTLYFSMKFAPLKFIKEIFKSILSRQKLDMTMMGLFMEKFYRPILEEAKKLNLTVLDLPNILNPNDPSLYISGIKPSKKGGGIIAEELAFILNQGVSDKSRIFSKNLGLRTCKEVNPNEWTICYPPKV